jgi:hypothetical protein
MKQTLGFAAAVVAALCSSAYIVITLTGTLRTQAMWITGLLIAATVVMLWAEDD